eukprot:8756283-Lingulodinium_polyedra.AAC.1
MGLNARSGRSGNTMRGGVRRPRSRGVFSGRGRARVSRASTPRGNRKPCRRPWRGARSRKKRRRGQQHGWSSK